MFRRAWMVVDVTAALAAVSLLVVATVMHVDVVNAHLNSAHSVPMLMWLGAVQLAVAAAFHAWQRVVLRDGGRAHRIFESAASNPETTRAATAAADDMLAELFEWPTPAWRAYARAVVAVYVSAPLVHLHHPAAAVGVSLAYTVVAAVTHAVVYEIAVATVATKRADEVKRR